MILAVIGLVGFTIATNDNVSSETAILSDEFAPVQEESVINASIIRYIDLGTVIRHGLGQAPVLEIVKQIKNK